MSDFDHRNQAFDYTPPTRGGSGSGALMFIGGIVVLFILAVFFMGSGPSTAPEDGASAPAPAVEPSPPAVPAPVD